MITTLTKRKSLMGFKDYVENLEAEYVVSEDRTMLTDKIGDSRIKVKKGASLQFIYFGIKGSANVPKIEFELEGNGSNLNFLGFIVGTGSHLFKMDAEVRHKTPGTKAIFSLYSALFDKSKVDFKGTLAIDKKAQLSDSYLAHHTLLLSEHARTKTIPSLEILADDVKAGHAATVGKVNSQDLFYLLSRGIQKSSAEHLLITGFFETQLKMIADEDLRNSLRQAIIKSLPFYEQDFMR